MSNDYVGHILYLIKHKLLVFKYRKSFPFPLVNAIVHDWDKLLPLELFAYARYHIGKRRDKITMLFYPYARMMHTEILNKHHWERWCGEEIPQPHLNEMIVDWYAAAAMQHGNVCEWWENNRHGITFGNKTKKYIDDILI